MEREPAPGTSKNWRSRSVNARHKKESGRYTHHKPKTRQNSEDNASNGHRVGQAGKQQGTRDTRVRHVGFQFLFRLAQSDSKEILSEYNRNKNAIMVDILQKPIERLDLFPLILEIASRVCTSNFPQLKLEFILGICNSSFVSTYLMLYLSNLPYVERKRENLFYWNDQEKFWANLIVLLETITAISPSTAMAKCRALIENISKGCLESLKERHNFDLPEEFNLRLQTLRNSIAVQEKDSKKKVSELGFPVAITEEEPPTSFRELPLLPTEEDLLETKPFVRPNIVEGAYSDVDHYLDVQFRLLREDCFGPVREGIQQYLKDPTRRHYDSIRVFQNVTFAEPYVSSVTFANIIEVDKTTKKSFRNIKWEYNKRFLFGGLVLLTKDNCKSFIVATVADREPKYLSHGKIPISVINEEGELDFNNAEKYLMIESEVYFEPYYHVLKVLQDRSFPEHLAMKKYIVDVENTAELPKYIRNPNILPTAAETGLNESQYEAFKLAATHEFAVIQGPPGTGKTYMGVEVAKYLLRNFRRPGCLILIICYTNHALDQFLEAILKITDSIVRIGGRSRLEIMKEYNLNTIRNKKIKTQFHSLYYDKKDDLKNKIRNLKQLQRNIASLDTGIVSSKVMNLVDESRVVCGLIGHRNESEDYLTRWLFEKVHCDYTQPIKYNIDYLQNELKALNFTGIDNSTNYIEDIDDEFDIEDAIIVSQICAWSLEKNYNDLLILMENLSKSNTYEKEQTILNEIKPIETYVDVFKQMRSRWEDDDDRDVAVDARRPWQMPLYNRWKLYFQWTTPLKAKLLGNITVLQTAATAAKTEYDEARMILDLELIKNHKVVGMTTTGAARLQKMIRELGPPIIIVEEAAEVLEQHIVTSLHKRCRHLILIGDQQQLRPSAACMRLARHYNIEVSLFERMINNKMHSRRLAVQHRMRPDFAALICPHIYADLSSHASVENLPNIRGITKNLFFFTHQHKEESGKDSTSKLNSKEADIALRLANYLMQQGYEPEDVTILCAYAAQMFYMKREKKQYIHLEKVKVTVVDNYQGEESKIIILSLVRNNLDNNVGFLATPNRVCVALSRAKEGFYIFGNIEMLKSQSELWRKISGTLEEKEAVGSRLQLQCYFHPEQITNITSDVDFDKCPEGGCLLKCNLNLSCGHLCPHVCHAYDRNHENIKCIAKCERILCELQHVCPLPCATKCGPCKVVINKHLPCGHHMNTLCSTEPKDVKCMTTVTVTLPHCGHESQKACYVDVKCVMCSVPCEGRLMCGHVCQKYCHVISDPDHERTTCEKPCTKPKKGCTFTQDLDNVESPLHQCQKMCFEDCDECRVEVVKKRGMCTHTERVPCNVDVEANPCRKKCARLLPCSHHCKRKCHEPCGGCKQLVKKEIPACKHTIKIECSVEPTKNMCIEKCKTILGCGHICPKQCKERCDANECNQRTNRKVEALCGHEVYVPCKLALYELNELRKALLAYCESPCESVLGCEHPCKGSCSKCCQGRLHAPCASKCDKDMICGHRCVEPCNEICPPCNKPCEVRCPHSKCTNKCGSPCVICKEKCVRNCEHGKCIKLCGQPCSVAACSAPCPRTQKCGHRCRGLCGHPCPAVCRLCDPQHFPKDFLGEDYEDDAILVLLEDCNHIMEVEELDTWMSCEMETIGIKSCPKCRKPILNSYRYKDLINKMLKNDINPVKEKVYGTKQEISLKAAELNAKIQQLEDESKANDLVFDFEAWEYAHIALLKHRRNRKLSLMQIEMCLVYSNILEILWAKKMEYSKLQTTIFGKEFTKVINVLCRHLARNVKKINHQQQQDIEREINRVHAILQFEKLVEHPFYKTGKHQPEIVNAFEGCKKIIFGIDKFFAEDGMTALKSLQEQLKASGVVVTAQERAMVVKAIGLKAGHWFKCPNGHVYCIGECGGAMQVATCPDCGERIGGSQHALLATNSHASEMDNSRFPAWSEQYNNLNNFRFD